MTNITKLNGYDNRITDEMVHGRSHPKAIAQQRRNGKEFVMATDGDSIIALVSYIVQPTARTAHIPLIWADNSVSNIENIIEQLLAEIIETEDVSVCIGHVGLSRVELFERLGCTHISDGVVYYA